MSGEMVVNKAPIGNERIRSIKKRILIEWFPTERR